MADASMSQPENRPQGESPVWTIVLLGALAVLMLAGVLINARTTGDGSTSPLFAQWKLLLGVLVTVGIFSILYKENPVFRFLEHIFIGLAAGYTLVIYWVQVIVPRWLQPMLPHPGVAAAQATEHGQWWLFFALPIGLLFYSVYFPKLAWLNRLIISVFLGYAAGLALQAFVGGIAPQIVRSFKAPITTYNPNPAGALDANNIQLGSVYLHPYSLIFLIVLFCTMAYFFFTVEHRTAWMRRPAIAGRYFMMITLGAIFGTTVMGRFSLVIGRFSFLIEAVKEWIGMLAR